MKLLARYVVSMPGGGILADRVGRAAQCGILESEGLEVRFDRNAAPNGEFEFHTRRI